MSQFSNAQIFGKEKIFQVLWTELDLNDWNKFVCFFFSGSQDIASRYHEQFVILSSIIVLSLPWPIISYTMIRRIFKKRLRLKRGHSLTSNTTSHHALFTDGQRFLVLCLRSFIIFVFCWLPYAVFGFLVFIKGDISHENN